MPGWDGFDVPAYVRERIPVPVMVDNDVNIMALGEHFTAWSEYEHLLFIKAATGIGCGIIASGQVYRGAQGAAGDMGHIRVAGADDIHCRCGNTGCLEAVASGAAIAKKLTEQGIQAGGSLDVVELARSGSVPALRLVRQAGRDIGEVLAGAVNFFNLAFFVFAVVALIAGSRDLPASLTLYGLLLIAPATLFGTPQSPLMGTPRYVLVAFPVFIVLGLLLRNKLLFGGWLILSALASLLLCALFVSWRFVA
jgi:predicted NBD/HSP70 family sugar kinase